MVGDVDQSAAQEGAGNVQVQRVGRSVVQRGPSADVDGRLVGEFVALGLVALGSLSTSLWQFAVGESGNALVLLGSFIAAASAIGVAIVAARSGPANKGP